MRLAKHVENEDTWQRYVEVETHRRRETGVPRAPAKVQVKMEAKARHEHLKRVCAVEKEGHKKAECQHKSATCSNCGKVGHLRAVFRNTNTHEIEKDADESSPEVAVEEVWCMAVQDAVGDGHCDCTEKHDALPEDRDGSKF